MTSYYHARREKYDAWVAKHWRAEKKERDAAERDAKDAEFLKQHLEIGILMRRGKKIYYVNAPSYREASDPMDLVTTNQ